MDSSTQELVDELAYSWLEMHKKSALTHLVLTALSKQELWARDLEIWIRDNTGWSVHERALYRMLRRLEQQGVIVFRLETVERSGAERKIYTLTSTGKELLRLITQVLVYLNEL